MVIINWAQKSHSVIPAPKDVPYSADEYKGLDMSADYGLLLMTEYTSWVKLSQAGWFRAIPGDSGTLQGIPSMSAYCFCSVLKVLWLHKLYQNESTLIL